MSHSLSWRKRERDISSWRRNSLENIETITRKKPKIEYSRSCMLCLGSKRTLGTMIRKRTMNKSPDFMKYVYAIKTTRSIDETIKILNPVKRREPFDNINLHVGYGGQKCMELIEQLVDREKFTHVVCGIEPPNTKYGYKTYDLVFPQGKIEEEESPKKAAIREFEEETGIDLTKYTYDVELLGDFKKFTESEVSQLKRDTGAFKNMAIYACYIHDRE